MNVMNCCRICLEEAAFTKFSLNEYIGSSTIKSLIQQISNVNLDFKPDLICNECLNELKTACSFKQKCETSEQFIKNINFSNIQIFDNDNDDFIDTNLFDEDYMYEDDLKPDFEEILEDHHSKPEQKKTNVGVQVDGGLIERKKSNKSKRFTIKCHTCDEEFPGPKKLISHSRDFHQDLKPFKCNYSGCTKAYQNPKALKVHRRSHEEEKRFKCLECPAGFFVKANLISHTRTHLGEKFKCDQCDKSFSSLSYFKQHQISHIHETTGQFFICTFAECNKKFSNRFALRSHLIVHSERKFVCNICLSTFKTQQSLKVHSLKHSIGESKLFQCHICGFATKYRQQYHDHVKSHSAKRDLECFHCGKKFTKKTLLVIHMQTHLTVRNFICNVDECKKAFKTYNSYYAHKRKHQTKSSPKFNCASCDKVFSSHSVYTAHLKCHTGEKTFTCHLCSKAYTHKQNLNNHLKTAHIENDLTFKCDLCFKVLANSNSLRVHINKIHKADKNIECPSCKLKFASAQLLDVHKKFHLPKAFNCEFCNYSANYEADLKRHQMKVHEENKEA